MGDGRPFLHEIVTNINALPTGATITHNQLPEPSPNTFMTSSMQQHLPLPEYDSIESELDLEEICMFMDTDAGLHWLKTHTA
jgi:hypothetical protein